MHLFRDGVLLGSLVRYSYETPWASAWLEAADPATITHCAAIFSFYAWVETIPNDLPDAEADARYHAELLRRELTDTQISAIWSDWAISLEDGTTHPITVYSVEDDGYIRWRW